MVLNILCNEIPSVHLKQGYMLAHWVTNQFQWAPRYPWSIGQWPTMPIGKSGPGYGALLGHIIPIPRQLVFVLTPKCCVLSGETRNNNFIVFGLTPSALEPTIYSFRGERANHYNTKAVVTCMYYAKYVIIKYNKVQTVCVLMWYISCLKSNEFYDLVAIVLACPITEKII